MGPLLLNSNLTKTASDLGEQEIPDLEAKSLQGELLRWHHCLGHISFACLKQLAKLGDIPRKLAKVPPPKCAGCMFGAMTKRPWQDKGKQGKIRTAIKPGECVSIDRMESNQLGFIAQMKGNLTTQRYRAATVFVDHFSRVKFIFLMTSLTSNETVQAKVALENFAENHGVKIMSYHCDNG